MVPLVKVVPSKPRWERIRDRPVHQTVDGQFLLSFTYAVELRILPFAIHGVIQNVKNH